MKNIVVISVSKFIDLNIKRISINNIYIENRQPQFVIINNDYTILYFRACKIKLTIQHECLNFICLSKIKHYSVNCTVALNINFSLF